MIDAREVKIRGPLWDHLYAPYAEARWGDIPRETLIEGPAGTGKSIGIAHWLDMIARDWPGCRILVVRKTRVSLSQSWMASFENKCLRPDDPLMTGTSRAHRDAYVYANGAELVMGGMDNETKLFSTEYDIIYINEANELTQGQVESLHRALRNGVLPFQCMVMDCNPDSEFHWLNVRCNSGPTVRVQTKLWHNPGYYDGREWTRPGSSYLAGLKLTMTGVRYQRLVEGLWVTAEGTIIPLQKDKHVIKGRVDFPLHKRPEIVVEGWSKPVPVRFFYGTFDHGFRNPGTFQVWAVDDQKRAFFVEETYLSGRDEDFWADAIVDADKRYMLHRVVCDSASPEKISKFNRVVRAARDRGKEDTSPVCIPAGKGQRGGKSWLEVQAIIMRRQFELDPTIGVRTFLFEDSLRGEADPTLVGSPKRFLEEAVGWTFEKYDPARHRGMPKEIGDPDKPNHGIDAASYGFEWLETHDMPDSANDRWGDVPPAPGSWAEFDLTSKRLREAEQKRKNQWH